MSRSLSRRAIDLLAKHIIRGNRRRASVLLSIALLLGIVPVAFVLATHPSQVRAASSAGWWDNYPDSDSPSGGFGG